MKNDLQTALSIIYEWSLQTSVKNAARTLNLSPSTVSTWYNHIRNVLSDIFVSLADSQIGGVGHIIEIDECLLVKNKNRRGRMLAGQQISVDDNWFVSLAGPSSNFPM